MICPQCGFDMGTKHRCLRCGYEVKTLVAVDEETAKKREEENVKVIDPSSTYLTDEYGYSDDFVDPFDALFGNIFDPFAGLLNGLFGLDIDLGFGSSHRFRKQPEKIEPKKKGNGKVVEVNEVELCDENGNPINMKRDKSKKKKNNNKKDE